MSILPTPFTWVSQLNKNGNEKLILFCLAEKSDQFGRINISLLGLVKESGLSCLKVMRIIRQLVKDKVIYAEPNRNFYYLRVNIPAESFFKTKLEV